MLCLERGLNERTVIVVPPSDKETVITQSVTEFGRRRGEPRVTIGFDAPEEVRVDRLEIHVARKLKAAEAKKVRVGAEHHLVGAGKAQAIP